MRNPPTPLCAYLRSIESRFQVPISPILLTQRKIPPFDGQYPTVGAAALERLEMLSNATAQPLQPAMFIIGPRGRRLLAFVACSASTRESLRIGGIRGQIGTWPHTTDAM